MRGTGDPLELAQAVAEGLTLAEFYAGSYKTTDPPPGPPPVWTVAIIDANDQAVDAARGAVARGRILGECSNMARELANEPGNTLTPREFAKRTAALASEAGVKVEILDETQIEKLGMGLLLGVARGSAEPPRVIVFRYDPPGAPATPVLGLVGKGITFDTGGISIKPAEKMEQMKDDMAGGAAVACAMRAIALLKAPMRVIGVVPTTENMPGGRAIKPGDVLKSAAGKTVEVINTDAEGRLILGDGLWYARQLGATHLVDVATLTGAVVVALGKITSGLFGSPDAWVERVRRVADRAGDRAWPMPLFDEYRDQIKSDIADMMNTGGRAAGVDHRRDVPQGVRRRPPVGAPRHRRHRVGRRAEAVSAQGPERRRGPDAGGAGVREVRCQRLRDFQSQPLVADHREDHPARAEERPSGAVRRAARLARVDRPDYAGGPAARRGAGGR